jgi:hypothetical protein
MCFWWSLLPHARIEISRLAFEIQGVNRELNTFWWHLEVSEHGRQAGFLVNIWMNRLKTCNGIVFLSFI